MIAKKVYETLGFQRGQSSKQALNIGLRAKISSWLDEMEVINYTINDDFTIDVNGHVNLRGKLDGNLPSFIKFGKVDGFFDIGHNYLSSLEGAPQSVDESFSCSNNNLTSLEEAPRYVGYNFYCTNTNDKVQFTEEDVKKVCNVKGDIYV